MRTRFTVAAAFVLMGLFGQVQVASAQGITIDASRRLRIDEIFSDYDQPTSPGCALGIMSDGRIIYARGYGMAKLAPPFGIDSTTLFDVGSMSKQFAAAVIVRLAQQGKLELADDVRKYVPELPDYGTPITINHLIWHTSGLRNYTALLLLGGHDFSATTTQELALRTMFRQRKLDFTPGSRFFYSNSGYILLALIAERVSGKNLNALTREYFFNPLSMPQSVYRTRPDMPIPNQALGYDWDDELGFVSWMSNWVQYGDGSLHTSIEEIQKWDENFYSGQVGGPDFVAQMHRTGKLNDGTALVYARGQEVDAYRGLRQVRHGGDSVGYHANMLRFPDQHTSIAVFCNIEKIDQYTLSNRVADVVLKDVFTQPKPVDPPAAPSLPLRRFVGDYYDRSIDQVFSVREQDGRLILHYIYLTLQLVPLGQTTFMAADTPLSRIEFAVEGGKAARAVRVKLFADERDEAPVQATRFTPAEPRHLHRYAGTFYSRELNVTWKLAVVDQQLTLVKTPQIVLPIAGPLSPGMTDSSFHSLAGLLRFTNDAAGRVDGFGLSFNRMRDIRFERVRQHLDP